MPNTQGFNVVAEVPVSTLREFLQKAWDNGGDPARLGGSIPQQVILDPGNYLPPYNISEGHVTIPKEGLSLDMATNINGVTVSMDTEVQITLDEHSIPVPSLNLLNMLTHIGITAPFGTIPGSSPNIGVIFKDLARNSVIASLSTDPIAPITGTLVEEYLHELYKKAEPAGQPDAFPHNMTITGVSYPNYINSCDVFIEFFSDPDTPAHKITASFPSSNAIEISIPAHLKMANIESNYPMLTFMGVTARIIITAPFSNSGGLVKAALSSATVDVSDIQPAEGEEGSNYTTNKSNAAIYEHFDMELMMKEQIISHGQVLVSSIGDILIQVPTKEQFEKVIGDYVHKELLLRQYFGVWTPLTPEGSPVTINSAEPRALSSTMAIGINSQGNSNAAALGEFVPAGAKFAVALDGTYVKQLITDIINNLAGDDGHTGLPVHYNDIEGHAVDLTDLQCELKDGKIHFTGSATVHDVFCGADCDISFWCDVGLRWTSVDSSGSQSLEPYVIDKDADLPWWAWLIAVLTFFAGIIIGIITTIIIAIVESIVDKIGGATIEGEVAGQLKVIGAWPQNLEGVGEVESHFDKDVGIDSSGLLFSGPLTVSSQDGLTAVYSSDAGGPYIGFAAIPVAFHPGYVGSPMQYLWNLESSIILSGISVNYAYKDNGLYVVLMTVIVNQPGGAVTYHDTPVYIRNTPPVVHLGNDIEIDEGQMVTFIGTFEDIEYLDKHETLWDFGDNSLPVSGTLIETNNSPKAKGVSTAQHAYGDNGEYIVKLAVRDVDGGVGVDSLKVKVRNVPPKVYAGGSVYAYPCSPVNLIAIFTDPGWLDTHVGQWHFGDEPFFIPATVYEVNKAPFGYGIAFATHTYRALADYCAECIVIDDDGGIGKDFLHVHVVDILNAGFENGFRNLTCGSVANEWEPFQSTIHGSLRTNYIEEIISAVFEAEEYIVHGGQRSQRIYGSGQFRAGIMQKIGANKGWEYQVIVWYHIDENKEGKCLIGIDPKGGANPFSPDVVWVQGNIKHCWTPLTSRTVAQGDLITVFLAVDCEKTEVNVYFDDVNLLPYPCKIKLPPRPEVPEDSPQKQCVDWTNEKERKELPQPYSKSGFTFLSLSESCLRIERYGIPENTGKLVFGGTGLLVKLPFEANCVNVECVFYPGREQLLEALDINGTVVARIVVSANSSDQIISPELCAAAISVIRFPGNLKETHIIKICAFHSVKKGELARIEPIEAKSTDSQSSKKVRKAYIRNSSKKKTL